MDVFFNFGNAVRRRDLRLALCSRLGAFSASNGPAGNRARG